MSLPNPAKFTPELPESLRPAFAPIVKHALGVGFGVAAGGCLSLFALIHPIAGLKNDAPVWLIGNNFLPGYAPTALGAFMGALWGFGLGFACGWLLAWVRNFSISLWVTAALAKEQLRADSEFLDEI